MFTGIIETLGTVTRSEPHAGELLLRVQTGFPDLQLGESVAVNGACLTVTEFTEDGEALFFVSGETLDKTQLAKLKTGDFVNLERALLPTTRLSGHYVQGHVDGVGKFLGASPRGDAREAAFEIPKDLARYCISKGSIALDGVSLTINSINDQTLSVILIPHTWEQTRFHCLKPGDAVNVEVDLIAKYVEKLTQ